MDKHVNSKLVDSHRHQALCSAGHADWLLLRASRSMHFQNSTEVHISDARGDLHPTSLVTKCVHRGCASSARCDPDTFVAYQVFEEFCKYYLMKDKLKEIF